VGDFGARSGITAFFEKSPPPGWVTRTLQGGAKTSSYLFNPRMLPATVTVIDNVAFRIAAGAAVGDTTIVGAGVAGLAGTAVGAALSAGGFLLVAGVRGSAMKLSMTAVTSVGAALGSLGGNIARDFDPEHVGYVTDRVVGKFIVDIAPDFPGKRWFAEGMIASRDWVLEKWDGLADGVNPYVGGWLPKAQREAPARQ
jgi:hypothetical protein